MKKKKHEIKTNTIYLSFNCFFFWIRCTEPICWLNRLTYCSWWCDDTEGDGNGCGEGGEWGCWLGRAEEELQEAA